ncbi:DNA internalization-related competence protein ComEC/Rec2 [Mycoplasmatota bacterium]|nr:DNA internalization-related competence protein ComEC/Rec2 [Mycoplasmatota bacterium]
MRISKIIYVVNHSIYLLIALSLVGLYLNNHNVLIMFLIIGYLCFLLKKSFKLLLFISIFMGIYYWIYHYQSINLYQIKHTPTISCMITTIPEYKPDYIKFSCKSEKNNILVYLTDTKEKLKIGDVVKMSNELELVKNNTVPNQFNYAKFLKASHIAYQNRVNDIKIISHNETIHYKWINQIIIYYQDLPISDYLLSFIIGNKHAFDDDFTDKTQTLNISHLFVVSGFHIGCLYVMLKYLFKYLKLTKETSEIIISIGLIFFLILNNFSISVLRAVILIISLQMKHRFKLPIENIHLLSLIASINLIINPFIINHIGFILSYLITLILFLSHTIFMNYKHFIISLFKVNIIAQLFSLPIIANFNFSYNFISFLITPLLSLYYTLIIFPMTIICLIFKPFSYYLQDFFYLFEKMLNLFVSFSYLDINIGCFNVSRYIIYYFLLYLLMKKLEKRQFSYLFSSLLIIVILFYYQLSLTDEVTFIDVGQGDSIFVHSNINHCSALIDTGGSLYYKPGENVVNYLKSIQTRQLDVLFITHTDIDHANDYHLIINQFKVKTIVFNYYDTSELQTRIEKDARAKKINILKLKAYNKVTCGNLSFHILNPVRKNNTINDNSLVLFLIFNEENYLFMGDATSDLIYPLKGKTIDFLKVSHHGSKYQTSQQFLKSHMIKQAMISVGKNNYHHPSNELLTLLDEQKIIYYRTDRNGTISVKYYLKKKRMILLYQPYNIDV